MRTFFNFWWRCIKNAFWGNSSFANDWAWFWGIPIASGLGAYISARQGAANLSTGYPILDGLVAAFVAYLITWLIAFFIRLLREPVDLFHAEKSRADQWERWIHDYTQPTRDTWFQHAIFYVVHRAWPTKEDRLADTPRDAVESALTQLQQAAVDRQIAVWGKKYPMGHVDEGALFEEIPTHHWRGHRVFAACLGGKPEDVFSALSETTIGEKDYRSLMVSKGQVEFLCRRSTS
jgi:hypothetical protein